MNIYEKLQLCRVQLQKEKLNKSGKNTYTKYSYFELADFLPKVNELFHQNKLSSFITFNGLESSALLTIVNAESPEEKIMIESPTAKADLKGCTPIQEIGAIQTYIRRYLYLLALEIVENDVLDHLAGKNDTNGQSENKNSVVKTLDTKNIHPVEKAIQNFANKVISEAQLKRLYAIAKENLVTPEIAKEILKAAGYDHANEILIKDYENICKKIEDYVPFDNRTHPKEAENLFL